MNSVIAWRAGAGVLFILAMTVMIWAGWGDAIRERQAGIGSAYFLDLNTGKIFTVPADRGPPIEAPSGPRMDGSNAAAGVRAYVFGCNCANEKGRYVAWVEKRTETDGAKTTGSSHPLISGSSNVLIAPVNGDPHVIGDWVKADSQAGRKIVQNARKPCADGSLPRPCHPTGDRP